MNLNLVVWGSNLTSQVGRGRLTKVVSNNIKIPPYQYSVIIGLILSDGWVIIPRKDRKNARTGFKQALSNSSYLWHVFSLLSHYCNRMPYLVSGTRLGKKYYALEFVTRVLPCFTELYFLFYPDKGVKIIPQNIFELLTPVALAHLIMGDGHSFKGGGVSICTDSFSVEEVVRLMNVLIIRYNLKCTLHTRKEGQYRIFISKQSRDALLKIVYPYMIPSMYYKIN